MADLGGDLVGDGAGAADALKAVHKSSNAFTDAPWVEGSLVDHVVEHVMRSSSLPNTNAQPGAGRGELWRHADGGGGAEAGRASRRAPGRAHSGGSDHETGLDQGWASVEGSSPGFPGDVESNGEPCSWREAAEAEVTCRGRVHHGAEGEPTAACDCSSWSSVSSEPDHGRGALLPASANAGARKRAQDSQVEGEAQDSHVADEERPRPHAATSGSSGSSGDAEQARGQTRDPLVTTVTLEDPFVKGLLTTRL